MMLAIDLGCCAGGASMGLSRAGFELLGVDIEPQPEYPFRFIQADALEFDFSAADFVWASPNCQPFSVGTAGIRKQGKVYPDWLPQIRQRLQQSGLPYIIENVPGAPLLNPIRLWGQQFGLSLVRCRLFESNLLLLAPPPAPQPAEFFTVAGHQKGTLQEWQEAMQMPWVSEKRKLSQAVPPAYSECLGRQILQHLTMRKAA